MLARVVTLRFDPGIEAFDDAPLQDFLKAREVFAIREHFFVRDEVPYLAVLVTYGLRPTAVQAASGEKSKASRSSWRPPVPEADLPLWNALRDWRAERAKRDGVPTYVIASNRQLASMVEKRPGSMSALGAIEGIGKAKLENYGQELLALLARPRTESAARREEARPAETTPRPAAEVTPRPAAEATPRPAAAAGGPPQDPSADATPPAESSAAPQSSAAPALFEGADR